MIVFVFLFFFVFNYNIYSKEKSVIHSRAYILYDLTNQTYLANKNKDISYPAASLTKLVTAMAAREILNDKKIIRIRKSSVVDNPIESRAGLKTGENYSLKMLLYALLVPSGNDAAYAIAEGVSGSKTKFAELMNDWKKRNGLEKSYFADPAGLSPHTKIAPTDLQKVLEQIYKDTVLKKILLSKKYTLKSEEGRVTVIKSRNKLFHYKGFNIYGKTGTTISSGHCFAGFLVKDKKTYIIIIMGAKNAFTQIKNAIRLIQ